MFQRFEEVLAAMLQWFQPVWRVYVYWLKFAGTLLPLSPIKAISAVLANYCLNNMCGSHTTSHSCPADNLEGSCWSYRHLTDHCWSHHTERYFKVRTDRDWIYSTNVQLLSSPTTLLGYVVHCHLNLRSLLLVHFCWAGGGSKKEQCELHIYRLSVASVAALQGLPAILNKSL